VEHAQLVYRTWDAVSRGDLEVLESALAPDAKWRAVEDGPWNCENRAAILEVMGRNLENGLSGTVEDVLDVGDRAVGAFRPNRDDDGEGWPLDNGIRYVVITTRDGLVTEMKGCADRKAALAYAQA
jgi:ketosteroid isomerase-like protein